METKILKAVFGGGTSTVTNKRTRTDYGQVLEIIGIDLPDTFECIFSNSATSAGTGKKMIGSSQRVLIPDEYLTTGQTIYAWILLHDTEDDGRHMYSVRIPVADMPDTSPEEPTPVEQSVISQAITALNSAVTTTTQKAQEASDSADRAEHAAEDVEGYAERAESAQQAAESARDIALESKVSAQTSAATATEKASEAISSATTASQSAITAESASESSQASADASAQSALRANQFAVDASARAHNASEYAQTASGYANNANTDAQTASQKALEAAQSASTATQAKTDAITAKQASETAQGLAESARDEAATAKEDAESARDEAQSIADGITGKVEQIDSNTDRIESLEDDRYKPYAVDTASGVIAHFTDGADNIPMKDVLVHIEPVQEGSGDPSPDNVRPITGWTGAKVWDDSKYGRLINWNQKLKNPHFDEGTNGLRYWASNNVSVSNLEDGSVLLTITAVHETRSFYNLFTQSFATTTKQHKFLVLWDYKPAHTHNVGIFLICRSGGSENYEQTINDVSAGKWNRLAYFVPAQDKTFYQLQFALNTTVNSGYSVGDVDYIRYPQMFDLTEMFGAGNEPTTLDEFKALFPKDCYDYNSEVTCVSAVSGEPYAHVQVSWQSEAGTVYGGTLDVTKGELVVDRAVLTYNTANMNNSEAYPGWKDAKVADIAGAGINTTMQDVVTNVGIGVGVNTIVVPGVIFLPKQLHNNLTQSDWKALALDIQIVLPFATPITYTLTPQEITSLLGENNVWADTGDVSVEYRADVKLYINKKITEAVSALT